MLKQEPLKTTVWRADKAAAERATASLLAITYQGSGQRACRRQETAAGWQVLMPLLTAGGKKEFCVCLQYANAGPGPRARFRQGLITA